MKTETISLNRRTLLLGLTAATFAVTAPTLALAAGDGDISAETALERQQSGEMVLIDVRTPGEWRQTGIAAGAETIDMQDPEFLQKLVTLRESNPGIEFGFICASSNRSGQVQSYLAQNNVPDVYSVYGGMTGNGAVRGWIADGLPVEAWSGN